MTTDPWMRAMRRGDFAAAWEIGGRNRRVSAPETPRHFQTIWNGESLEGKRVLVRCYHGLGDTVQFIRYAPLLKAIAAEVIVWAQPALLELLRGVEGIDQLVPLHDGAPPVEYDVDVEIMELPQVFRQVLTSVPYLRAAPADLPGEGLAVGLVWQAGDWDARRSVPLPEMIAALRQPGVDLYSLQRGSDAWRAEYGRDVSSARAERTAGVMQALDLVITVDSFPAHLAGALGRPVWTLLHAEADWRWMEGRADSPWYPTMQLLRQRRAGDWGPVLKQAGRQLAARIAGSSARKTPRTLQSPAAHWCNAAPAPDAPA